MKKTAVVILLICASLIFADVFTSHLKPNNNNTLDIGTSILNWKDIYAAGEITGGTLTDGSFTVSGGAVTGASGLNSMWTNDTAYITLGSLSATLPIVYEAGDFRLSYNAADFEIISSQLNVKDSGVHHGDLTDANSIQSALKIVHPRLKPKKRL